MSLKRILVIAGIILVTKIPVSALTLDEAIILALENLPSFRAIKDERLAQEKEYSATLSPYLPELNIIAGEKRYYSDTQDYDIRNAELRISYLLWDSGSRKSQREIAGSNLKVSEENIKKSILDISYNVKITFYNLLAKRDILNQRRLQLRYAEKNFEVARGRYEAGVARRSDLLQASVRLEEARYRVIEAEGEMNKVLNELISLTGRKIDIDEVSGSLEDDFYIPEMEYLIEKGLNTPEVKKAELNIEMEKAIKKSIRSRFLPEIFIDATYTRNYGDTNISIPEEEKTIGIMARLNIFEWSKFMKMSASSYRTKMAKELVEEKKREVTLNITKSYEDLLTSQKGLDVAVEQLRFAEQNYEQAYGEYRVGKGDILSLIQAEKTLSESREKVIIARLNIFLNRANLERLTGINSLEEAMR